MKPRKDRNLRYVDGKWYTDFTFRGKRHREFGGWPKGQARNTLVKLRADLLDVARGFKKADVEDVLFETFADTFLELYSRPNKRAPWRDEISLENIKRFFKDKTLRAITGQDIEGYKAARRAEVAAGTINLGVGLPSDTAEQGRRMGQARIESDSQGPEVQRAAAPGAVPDAGRGRRLIDAAGPALRPIIIVALGTGMRRGEILALKWADLDFVRGLISITISKSGKPRKVPMSGSVAAALGAVPRRGEFVFMNGEPGQSVTSIKDAFRAVCAAAKITGFRFHDCRHTFASRALELGADLVSVSKILGHSSIAMTAKYLHASGEGQRLAVNRMGEFLDSTRQKVDTSPRAVVRNKPVNNLK